MNSKQQGQDNDKSPSAGKDAAQQSQTGKQDQHGGREAAQRKDFDKLMSESDQKLRDSTMQQGSDGGKQSR